MCYNRSGGNMSKACLVLEGGAMRGLFTAGVLDVLMENNIELDAVIGVSAGALFGANYCSHQIGRAIRYNKKYCKDVRYIGLLSYLFTGNIVNKNFAYYKLNTKLDKFDDEAFINSKKNFYATVTNMASGEAEYIKINSCIKDMEVLRASSAMPILAKPVEINGKMYLDGAVGDSIPIKKALDMDFDKIIVVLTQPKGFIKTPYNDGIINRASKKYKNYPKFVNTMKNRYINYNDSLKVIAELENKKEIFVIRPEGNLNVKRIERNKEKLQEVYDAGVNVMKSELESIKLFLASKK